MRFALSFSLAAALSSAALLKNYNVSRCGPGGFSNTESVKCQQGDTALLNYYDKVGYQATMFLAEKEDTANLGIFVQFPSNLWVGSASVCVVDNVMTSPPTFGSACGPIGVPSASKSTPRLVANGWRLENDKMPDTDPFHQLQSSNMMDLNVTAVFPTGFPFAYRWSDPAPTTYPWDGVAPTTDSNLVGGPSSFVALTNIANKSNVITYTPIATFASKGASTSGVVPRPYTWPTSDTNKLGFTLECNRLDAGLPRSVNLVLQGAAVSFYLGPKIPVPTKVPHKTVTKTAKEEDALDSLAGAADYDYFESVLADKDVPAGYGPFVLRMNSPGSDSGASHAFLNVQMPSIRVLKDIETLTYTWRYDAPITAAIPERNIVRVRMHIMEDCTKPASNMTDDDMYYAAVMVPAGKSREWVTIDFVTEASVYKWNNPAFQAVEFGTFALAHPRACVGYYNFGSGWLLPGPEVQVFTPEGSIGLVQATFAGFALNGKLLPISLEGSDGLPIPKIEADTPYVAAQVGLTVRTQCVTSWYNVITWQRCDSGVMCDTFDQNVILKALDVLPQSSRPLDVGFTCGPCKYVDAATPVPAKTPTPEHMKTKVPPKHTPTPKKLEDGEVAVDAAALDSRGRQAQALMDVGSSVITIRVPTLAAAKLVADTIRAGLTGPAANFLPMWTEFNFTDQNNAPVAIDISPVKDFTKAPWVTAGFVFSGCRQRDVCPCANATCSCDACAVGTESRIAINFPECGYPTVKTQKEADECITKMAQGCLIAEIQGPDRESAKAGEWTLRPASVQVATMMDHQPEVVIKGGVVDCSEWDSDGTSGLWWIFVVAFVVVLATAAVGGFVYMRNRTEEDSVRFTQPLATARGYESITPGLSG